MTTPYTAVADLLDRTVKDGTTGIVAEIRDANGSWFGTAGVADTSTGRERRSDERFRIGSTTKTFTATVLLQLVAEDRLGLDDTVEKWLPGLVRGGDRITVRQLLNQTTGLFNYVLDEELLTLSFGTGLLKHRFDVFRPAELVRIAMRHDPAFEPGESWAYSNTNYILAGMIIETVTRRSYADQVRRRIAEPLGLTGTYVPGDESTIAGPHPRLYSKLLLPEADAPVHDLTEICTSFAWAAGGMVSTTGDLVRFFGELLAGRLLPPALHEEMFTTIATDGSEWIPDTAYGLGVFAQKLPSGATVWGHGGAITGSWCYAMGRRDGGVVTAASVNCDWAGLGIFAEVLDAALG